MKRLLIISLLLVLVGCSDDCERNIDGCASDMYSCPNADKCYETKGGCSASGEC